MSNITRLQTPLTELAGVGPVVARGLKRLGLNTVEDLLNFYPRRWEDYSKLSTIAGLKPGKVTVKARIERLRMSRTARRRVPVVEAILSDAGGTTKAIWFGQPFLMNILKEGEEYLFAGEFAFKVTSLALQNPTFERIDQPLRAGKIIPIYSENSLVNSRLIMKLANQVIDIADEFEQIIPEQIVQRQRLLTKAQAIKQIHQPSSMKQLTLARKTLGFEELFILILTGTVIRSQLAAAKAPVILFDQNRSESFLKQLPYKLTDAQRIVAWQIFEDIKKNQPMHRLLQGDVGSGKTIVALFATVMAAHSGLQTALLVPTEILARQHFLSAQKLLSHLQIHTTLLVAGLDAKEKKHSETEIASGKAQLIIGTHSLLSEKIQFDNLGLVIVDEQHRFGVAQREALVRKGQLMPHLLAMTATPIPRSLAHVIYNDMDISIIDELPPGRKPVKTKLFLEIERANAYAEIDAQIEAGRQVFIICPRIVETDTTGAKSVQAEYERLQKTVFSHRRLGLLHGRLTSDEKKRVMDDFVKGKIDILIATTVVEVGVDVPNATVMMIEGADRFGLAALHQLRGRVGRAGHQSYAYLFAETNIPEVIDRLKALERTSDGMRLAQIDLETRGPGEVFGLRQHGLDIDLRMSSLTDIKLLSSVRSEVKNFFESYSAEQYPVLAEQVKQLQQVTVLD